MRNALRRAAAIGATAVLSGMTFGPATSRGQEAVRVQQKPIEHRVAVTLKLIQAYVIDRKGDPVGDLTRDEFVVLDNGERKTLTEFERHSLSGAPGRSKPAAGGATAPAGSASAAAEPEKASLARKYFLFFDFAFNNQRGARKAIDAAYEREQGYDS